jgi:hypothetical protein
MDSIPPRLWSQVNLAYSINGTEYSASIPSPQGNRFYRLRRQ